MDDTPFSSAEEDANALRKRDAPREADPHDFGAAEEALNDAAKRVNSIWIAFILLCVYIFIATFTVTPAALFRDAPVTMPIFNAALPLKVYFVMAPVLILAVHAYLIVLTKGLAEKLAAYEDVLKRSCKFASGRKALRARLDNSIVVRAMSAQYRDARGGIDYASRFIAGLTMIVMPVALLLLTQLIFLPYQDWLMTWVHRVFVIGDCMMCLWLTWPRSTRPRIAEALVRAAPFLFTAVTSVVFAAFPGEWIYATFHEYRPYSFLVETLFEGPRDPVDYVHKGGVLPFPNRLILPDDPKLAETAGASAGGVSLSVRGRNFRKAVFDRSNLARVDFSAADLTEASLQGAKLEGAKFECGTPGQVIAEPLDSTGDVQREKDRDCAKLERANFWNATLDDAGFREARMSDAKLGRASLKAALFPGAQMNGAILQAAVLQNANFSGAELLGANFDWARGNNVNFSKARMTFRQARLFVANFNDARLQGAGLFDAELPAANFDHAHMQGADLSGAALLTASFTMAYLHDATLDRANIKGASFESASLHGVSLKCVTPFRTDFGNVGGASSDTVGKKDSGAELLETLVDYPNVKCETDFGSSYYTGTPAVIDVYDNIGDDIPRDNSYDLGTYSDYPDFITELEHPEKLDAKTFADALKRLTSDLPEDANARVVRAFERLNPATRTKALDDTEKAFWADWTRKSAPQDNHAKALAARLESIACVADGAPHVARGLLWARRFDRLYEDKEKNERERTRILERLRKASGGGGDKCPGAKGLVEADFLKSAS